MKQKFLFETDNQSTVFMGYTEGFLYHSHIRFELLFVLGGCIDVELEGQKYRLNERDMLLVNPFEKHAYSLCDPSSRGFFIMFPSDFTPQVYDTLSNKEFRQPIAHNDNAFAEIVPLIRLIERHYGLTDFLMLQRDNFIGGIITTMVAILEQAVGLEAFSSAKSQDILYSVLKYLHTHYTEPINTRTVAEEFHYSERHFAKIFRDATNMTLPNYITEIRLNNAISMMSSGELIVDAAYKSGFNSLATFHRVFKARYGISPRAYIDNIYGKSLKLNK